MADSLNNFSFDSYSGQININPLDPSARTLSQMQFGMTGNPNVNLLNIEAEKSLLNTAIAPEAPVKDEINVVQTPPLFPNLTTEIEKSVTAQTMSSAEKTETKQVDMMKTIEDLKKQIIMVQDTMNRSVSAEFSRVNSVMNALVSSTQDQYSSEYVISSSEQQLFFDVKLEESSVSPEWS